MPDARPQLYALFDECSQDTGTVEVSEWLLRKPGVEHAGCPLRALAANAAV